MKILVAQARAAANGGAELYAGELARVLRADGHAVGTIDVDGHISPAGKKDALPRAQPGRILWNWAETCRAIPGFFDKYDRLILAFGEGPDLPVPTATIRHAPAVFGESPELLQYIGAKATPMRRAYVRLCRTRAGLTWQDRSDWTLANTEWTARLAQQEDNAKIDGILYPPLPARHSQNAAKRLAYRLLCLGRLAPNKRLEDAVRVLDILKTYGMPVELEICGYVADSYGRKLARTLARRSDIVLTLNASPEQKARALAEATIGLHMFRGEHFGICVAEMIEAGVVPIVFDDGGVRELVDTDSLRFQSLEGAAQATMQMLTNRDLRSAVMTRLAAGSALRRARAFDDEARRALQPFLYGTRHACSA